jgi:hypothetical protein
MHTQIKKRAIFYKQKTKKIPIFEHANAHHLKKTGKHVAIRLQAIS